MEKDVEKDAEISFRHESLKYLWGIQVEVSIDNELFSLFSLDSIVQYFHCYFKRLSFALLSQYVTLVMFPALTQSLGQVFTRMQITWGILLKCRV